MTDFFSLPVEENLSRTLEKQGIITATAVQEQTLPYSLAGKDVLAQAKTGSGKTLAFAIPALQKVDRQLLQPQVIVLCPTRELADQVAVQFRQLGQSMDNLKILTLCGGNPMGPQIKSLKYGCHVVVGTPGRIREHISKQRLPLDKVQVRVLDEADRMLDLGFLDDVNFIFNSTAKQAQTLLFSATLPPQVEEIANRYMRNPQTCVVEDESVQLTNIEQQVFRVEESEKVYALKALLTHYQPEKAIIFCNTRDQVQQLNEELKQTGFSVNSIQGGMLQQARTEVLTQFASDTLNLLIATDVAARGLDIPEVDLVVNYQVSEEPEAHIHRIGRTGRAGAKGQAVTLCSDKELAFLNRIEAVTERQLPQKGVQHLRFHANRIVQPEYTAITLNAGKKAKVRAGDIVGALVQDASLPHEDIGKITVRDTVSMVAVKARSVKRALAHFREGKVKGKRVRAHKLS